LLQEKAATAKAAGYDYAAALSDAKVLSEGRETYMQMCVPCHGERGGGSVGPNLADEFWIIEPTLAAVEEVIAAGNLEKGMPAWEPVVGVEKVRQLVVFVRSLQGTNPDKPKEPQGNPGKLP
jgi:cytochrome c oxidase cbb3-type subunit 3